MAKNSKDKGSKKGPKTQKTSKLPPPASEKSRSKVGKPSRIKAAAKKTLKKFKSRPRLDERLDEHIGSRSNSFASLDEESLDDGNGTVNELYDTVMDHDGGDEDGGDDGNDGDGGDDGFIPLDFDDDDGASIHTRTFQEYEENLEDEEEEEEEIVNDSNGHALPEFPWVRNRDHSYPRKISDWLTEEIKDFVSYVSPSESEIIARNEAMRRVRALVKSLWKDAEAHVFGSYATDLYLPGSDIDMVILSPTNRYDTRAALYQLSSKLRSSGIAKNVETIAKARVPIIKFVEKQSNVHIDVSFEKLNGIRTVETIQAWKEQFPYLRHFVLVIKQFLAKRKLNEVHTGGLGGFSVICMVVSFLSNHPKLASGQINVQDNLGVLLIEFFELYGKNFNYDDVALHMNGTLGYVSKDSNENLQGRNPFTLAIQDPNDDTNNISRGSFNMRAIKKAFGGAYDMLTERCYSLEYTSFKSRVGKSVLGNIINVKGPIRDFEDSTGLVRNESRDIHLTSTEGTREPTPEDEPRPEVEFISSAESSSDDDDHNDPWQQSSNTVVISDDSDSDSDPEPDTKVRKVDEATSDDDSRTSKISSAAKREFWLSKASGNVN
uniref:polynucleotide adenylyltransferase n=1 Tax=Blastobotrys adeninivorans TaxID=409370 RepID=A0A060TBB9_BLAAD